MDFKFVKNNYFEILLCIIITSAGLYKLYYPDLKKEESMNLKVLHEFHEYLIIIFELSSIYFLLFAKKEVKDIYIGIYCSIVTLVAFFYLYNRNILREIKDIFIYTNDIKSIFLRLIYVYILMYIMFYK